MAQQKDYLGFSWLVSLILALIPITSWLLGAYTRFKEGKLIAAIVRLVFGWNIVYILDIVFMVLNQRILRVLDI